MRIYDQIVTSSQQGRKLLAILLDPDKVEENHLEHMFNRIANSGVDMIFVGGSSVEEKMTDNLVLKIREYSELPVVLFPGNYEQISVHADAILFLSLISGRNPEYLIEQQIKAVPHLQKSNLEIIPTGYILIDGGKETAVQRVSETKPISAQNVEEISQTAVAGMYLGKKLIYLEAGSGAATPVLPEVIKSVKKALNIPLIVGGGIRSKSSLAKAYENGADLVVIGTAFEENVEFLEKIVNNEHIC
ncbi:geranylgeranylglyceryl/heptaprenylglyceryl phosphate synthase [Lutimonas zeaxanthinifaciens]|uniref:geranylgeranylglyceryl/heptaprenylglyceryl phosphate synthase n=1 Tax=Lutimonas zeaxanthinifaciens TaxID=3060215 RepID=UPI00265CFF0F|nr:geranylgeranylglyceryl/heptaprenylglyceryl phosphate synthase [Lutimonas sp. YSD2104]WKK66131.1 geranylgeranylglyceryl/heptaprenylglyceryl phosphate synthase [Lutimonas sp. YSD2104]